MDRLSSEERRGGLDDAPPPRPWLGTNAYWDLGPRLDTLDGDLSVVLGGRLQVDGTDIEENQEIEDAFGRSNPGVEVRRAFLELGALYRERYEFRLMVDASNSVDPSRPDDDNGFDFRDVFVGVIHLPVIGAVRAGYFKEPFGLEEITSSNDITFLERSLTDAMIERRNLGFMIHRRFTEARRMTTALGVFQDMDNALEIGDGYAVTGRLTGLPYIEDDGRRLLHLGAAASYRHPSDGQLQFASRPESTRAPVLVDTGTFEVDHEMRVGLEAATVVGPFSLQGEAVVTAALGPQYDPIFPSYYVMGSYVLTGEHRLYREGVGAFGRVAPSRSWGAVELVARYSFIDLDSDGIEGGRLQDWTLGGNWYLTHYVRLMAGYIAAMPEGASTQHLLQVRLQLSM